MNKTISINIAGFVFNIEEQAYEKLNQYLDAIKINFKNEDDCVEIMEDIEARIAELFQEKLSDRKEVIVESDVDFVAEVMGKPEDYITEDEPSIKSESNENESENKTFNSRTNKRLYRDETEGIAGGVCSGLAYYIGIDPVLVRITFVLLTILGGSGVLGYIILWIVMPKANTTAEILEMRGESVTLDSIKNHVKDVKTTILENTSSTRKNIKNAVDKGVRVGSKLGYVLSKIIGVGFILWGFFFLVFFVVILLGNAGIIPLMQNGEAVNFYSILEVIYPNGRVTPLFVTLIILVIFPIIALIVNGIRLLFGFKFKFSKFTLAGFIIWFISLVIFITMNIELGMNFKEQEIIDYEVINVQDSTGILKIDVSNDDVFSKYLEFNDIWNYTELIKIEEDKTYLGFPNLLITQNTTSNKTKIILHKASNGSTKREAIQRAEKIEYILDIKDGELLLDPYFSVNSKDKYRAQYISVEIQLPKGKTIEFGKNIDRILIDIENGYYNYKQDFANTKWLIDSNDDFICVGCDDSNHTYEYEKPNVIELEVNN